MNKVIEYGGVEKIPLYNCSAKSAEEWTEEFGIKRPVVGMISITYGVIMQILFIPCLFAMLESDLIRCSCYKIMFTVGIVDMLALAMNSIFTGFLAMRGAVFCTYPTVIYMGGLCGLGLWCCSCLLNILLLVNRTMHLSNSNLSDLFFKGHRTYFAMFIPIIYGLYFVFFTPTCVFSSKYYAWFYDPFIFPNRTAEYTNVEHGFNNAMIMSGTFVFYGYICFVLLKASRSNEVSKIHVQSHQVLYQSIVMCLINQISASVYVVMNFIVVPVWLIMSAQFLWQLDHGCPIIIYMTMNPTIRSRFLKKITFKKSSESYVHSSTVRPAVQRNTL
ncbi:unnamed protein product [Caenorhabditis sp. 36 PRJEB53466]|nr:unnamed protein product [Caenorhabditis sp. 36 PRJEB53466]